MNGDMAAKMSTNIGRQSTFAIETHGCKLNQADSLALARRFADAGLAQAAEGEAADVYVLNSCTVTHVADRKARRAARAARRRNPAATIVATGCYVQRAPGDMQALDEVDLVFGNTDKATLVRQVLDWRGEPDVACATGEEAEFALPKFARTRAMVKIQEGCDQVCAYCIVPKVRGRERSIPADAIVAEIRGLIDAGFKEVVLTGTQLGSYGFEWDGASLALLIERILAETAIARLRVSSLQPQEIGDELLRLWDDNRLCPHFHLPLQSGSDDVLRRMRRRYDAGRYAEAVERIRGRLPHAAVTADVIVGFPGETDADFRATYALCERMGFADMHAFPYSVRPGTSAAHFGGQLAPQDKTARIQALLGLAAEQAAAFRRGHIGATLPVLWEGRGSDGKGWSGLTDNYIRVSAESEMPLVNCITPATLVGLRDDGVVEAEADVSGIE